MDASADLAGVSALSQKGVEQLRKGRYQRAADKFAAAIAAARALPSAGPDCLVAAHLEVQHSDVYLTQSDVAGLPPADRAQALVRAYAALPDVLAVLQRRRAAGTLLAGGCTAREEAWWLVQQVQIATVHGLLLKRAAVEHFAPLMGYELYMITATVALGAVSRAVDERIAAVAPEQLPVLCGFAASAAELLAQPRPLANQTLPPEQLFVDKLQAFLAQSRLGEALPAARAQLEEAWRALERSGAGLQRRAGMPLQRFNEQLDGMKAAALEAAGSATLQRCGLRGCGAQEGHLGEFARCALCKAAFYCSAAHQAEDLAAHRGVCDAAQRAAAAALEAREDAAGRRRCALPACGAREAHAAQFQRCSACRLDVAYCSKAHQTEDWPSHKKACKASRKAA
jgi:hypothetical protein